VIRNRESEIPGGIAVALVAAGSEARVLDTIEALTGNGETTVSCIVIEDADMLRAAKLPFAIEVCRATNIVRRIDSGNLEETLRERAAKTIQLVRKATEGMNVNWTFDIVRKKTAAALLELVASRDVTLFCSAATFRTHEPAGPRPGSGWQGVGTNGNTVVVVLDRSAASTRAIEVARRIARRRNMSLKPIIVAASTGGSERIKTRIDRAGDPVADVATTLLSPSFAEIAARVREQQPAALVLPVSQLKGSVARILELEYGIDCPAAIVK